MSLLHLTDYIRNVEDELQKLKSKHRKLQQRLSDRTGSKVIDLDIIGQGDELEVKATEDNVLVKHIVEQLNNQIGGLRSEKVDLTTLLRKQQTRIQHLEVMVDQLSKEVFKIEDN